MALVLHPEDAAMPFISCAAIVSRHQDARPPVQKILRFVDLFCVRCWALSSGFRPWPTAQEVP